MKSSEQKEIGRIKLSDNQDIVASLVNNEKLDLRNTSHLSSSWAIKRIKTSYR